MWGKEPIVEQAKQDRLEAKLKNMLKRLDETETKGKQPAIRSGTGNIIRRRKGEKDKRISNP